MTGCNSNDMEDIEDILEEEELRYEIINQSNRDNFIFPNNQININNIQQLSNNNNKEIIKSIPGTQSIWLKTYGCSHNVSDSEYMQGVLSSYGYYFTNNKDEADLWLLNSCTVKDPSQAAFMHLVQEATKINKPLVIAGCVPQADRNIKGLEKISIVGVHQVDRVVEVVEETLKGHVVRLLATRNKSLPELELPKIRKNPLIEIVPLSTGCLGACTYCKTKYARGKLGSYDVSSIVNRIQQVVQNEGVMEVWLSSEDTGAYGIDKGTNLPFLLNKIDEILPEDVMLRIGMTNPPYILDHLEEIANCLNRKNVYSFLHVPIQSGSNNVLKDMNREYTVEEFMQVADFLLEKVPDLTLATDIICGFPGETEKDFDQTIELFNKYKFAIMNISQFYPRPGTKAAKMKRIHTNIVKNRSRKLTILFNDLEPYNHLIGTIIKIWINTEISENGTQTIGHSKNYTKVLIPRDDTLQGCTAMVKIIGSSRFHVVGVVVSYSDTVTNAIKKSLKKINYTNYITMEPENEKKIAENTLNNIKHKQELNSQCCNSNNNNNQSCCSSVNDSTSTSLPKNDHKIIITNRLNHMIEKKLKNIKNIWSLHIFNKKNKNRNIYIATTVSIAMISIILLSKRK